MAKKIWRFQCDIPYGVDDPVVTVFLGEEVAANEAEEEPAFIRQDVSNPVLMKFSELASLLDLKDSVKMAKVQADRKAEAKAAREAAAAQAAADAAAAAEAAQP